MKIAVVVPVYKPQFTSDERTSLRHLERYLSEYPRIVIRPQGAAASLPGASALDLPSHHFSNVNGYSKLLLSPEFYEAFLDYDYILIYQLDCLVFSTNLAYWCNTGCDYLGAPLFDKNSQPPRLSRVGNGGLSLRRVKAFLDVLRSSHIPSWDEIFTARMPDLKSLTLAGRWLKTFKTIRAARRGVQWYAENYSLNEDLFWSDRARLFHPAFRIAPMDAALRFAFDAHPRICFEKNGGQMPFGAHAWQRWDRAFWEPHLLS